MARSKRGKMVHLSKTTKKGMKLKKDLVSEVRRCVDQYSSIYIFSVETMRNKFMQEVRNEWRTSRFFYGKNKVLAVALGRTPTEEYKENLHEFSKRLKGEVGVMFTSESKESVVNWFKQHRYPDYARGGNVATTDVVLPEGPLDPKEFNHSQEPYLRQLGLPTVLQKGVIHLTADHNVCKEGDALSPQQCTILKLFGYTMAEFHINLKFVWNRDGEFEDLE